jgi:predicted dehydrogenase
MKAKIGIIGSGYMAAEYLKAASAVENLEIVSIYSRNKQTASALAEQFKLLKVAASLNDFAELNLDFLVICVPELATAGVITEFSRLNVPLLVEKPVGLTLTDALAIESLAKEKNLPIFAALNRRFYGSSIRVLNELSTTRGKRFIQVNDQENTIAARAAGQPIEVIENWMFANSIHIIDYISTVCRGEPTILFKSIHVLDDDSFVVNANIAFSSGDEAVYTCNWNVPGGWSVNISTPSKTWQLAPLESARSRELSDRQYSEFDVENLDISFKPGLVRMLIEVKKCIGGQSHDLITISEANRTMKLIDMVYSNG